MQNSNQNDADILNATTDGNEGSDNENLVIELEVHGMTCSVCTGTVEKELLKMEGVASVSVALATLVARITLCPGAEIGIRQIVDRIEDLGFTPIVPDRTRRSAQSLAILRAKEIASWRRAYLRSLIFAAPTFVISMEIVPWPDFFTSPMRFVPGLPLDIILQLLLTLPVLFAPSMGGRFHRAAFSAFRHNTATMDVLVSLGTFSAFFSSVLSTLYSITTCVLKKSSLDQTSNSSMNMSRPTVFFDTCTMIIFFISLGKYLEHLAKSRTSFALAQLLSLNPEHAVLLDVEETAVPMSPHLMTTNTSSRTVVVKVKSSKKVPTELLQVGDYLRVETGCRVPADGTIVEGEACIEEGMITGEPVPAIKKPFDNVVGGTVVNSGNFIMRATHVGANTALARIVTLVERAQASKAPVQRFADRIAGIFVPAVLVLSLLTLFLWLTVTLALGQHPFNKKKEGKTIADDALFCIQICISVIIVACPCTLGLSVPMAVMVGTGVGAQQGILIKGGEPLERVNKLEHVVFDKTGTLTLGKLVVAAHEIKSVLHWGLIMAAESRSLHPVGKSLAAYATERVKASKLSRGENFKTSDFVVQEYIEVPGQGIKCKVQVSSSLQSKPTEIYDIIVGNEAMLQANQTQKDDPSEIWTRAAEERKIGRTIAFLAINSLCLGFVALGDVVKPGAIEVVAHLQKLGVQVSMVTGDSLAVATCIAQQCGIHYVFARAQPDKKAQIVRALQQGSVDPTCNIGLSQAIDGCDYALLQHNLVAEKTEVKLNKTQEQTTKKVLGSFVNTGRRSSLTRRTMRVYDEEEEGHVVNPSLAGSIESNDYVAVPTATEAAKPDEETAIVSSNPSNSKKMMPQKNIILRIRHTLTYYFRLIRFNAGTNAHGKQRVVAMVGDGVNDAPGLAAASIGIALGTGTEIAVEAADVVIMGSSLLALATAIDLSKRIFKRIRINFFWAVVYNLIAIPLAMGIGLPWGVMLHPMTAGAAMALSSVSVVISSLMLRRYKRPQWIDQIELDTQDGQIETLVTPSEKNALLQK